LSSAALLNVNFAVNTTTAMCPFEGGSLWIRLKDNAGRQFQYQYFREGAPADLFNTGGSQWRLYQIGRTMAGRNLLNPIGEHSCYRQFCGHPGFRTSLLWLLFFLSNIQQLHHRRVEKGVANPWGIWYKYNIAS